MGCARWGQYEGNYYWGAVPVAFYYSDNKLHFQHQDWVGTERMRTSYNGAVEGTYDSLPFGDGITLNGLDQDADHSVGLDYDLSLTHHAQFRQYSQVEGRWLSPDPYMGSYNFANPQSLNRYAYVGNNPLAFVDPSGLVTCNYCDDGGGGGGWGLGSDGSLPCNDQDPFFCGTGFPDPTSWYCQHNPCRNQSSGGGGGGGAPSKPAQPTACQVKTLNAINSQFGTNLTSANILPTSDPNPTAGGQINTNFGVVSGLSPAQFNAIHSGRFAPSGVFGFITGYGSSLHVVAGPSGLDPSANLFGASNIGGMYSAGFTAHFDSAWAYNPFGALLHYLIDVRGHGSHRQPCP